MQRTPSTRAAATAMPDADASLWTALHAGVAQVAAEVRRRIDHVAYRAQQTAIRVPLATTRAVASALVGGESPDPAAVVALRERYEALLARDLASVDAGLYPRSLLYQIPFARYARTLPTFLVDLPGVLRRVRARDHDDLPGDVDLGRYPPYFRRNFHWQSDGYLSCRSAELYDLTVELLFAGTADVMRRQVIPPVSRVVGDGARSDVRLLDVACGSPRGARRDAPRAAPGRVTRHRGFCAAGRERRAGLFPRPLRRRVPRAVLPRLRPRRLGGRGRRRGAARRVRRAALRVEGRGRAQARRRTRADVDAPRRRVAAPRSRASAALVATGSCVTQRPRRARRRGRRCADRRRARRARRGGPPRRRRQSCCARSRGTSRS